MMDRTAAEGARSAKNRDGTRLLFSWPLVSVGAFDCWPGDARWRSENRVDEGHLIAFPGTPVEITQDGHAAAVTDPNRIVLYNRNQTYRRRLVGRSGDHCTYLVVSSDLLHDLASAGLSAIADPDRRPFAHPVLPIGRREHLEQRLILWCLAGRRDADALEIQERLVRLVGLALRSTAPSRPGPRRRPATEREHRRLVEETRELLATQLAQPMPLDRLATELGASAYHLARVFRTVAGMSLHAYRDELRLRTALPEILEGSRSLTEIALDHGYASPSHFTDRFRARYGRAPSSLRSGGQRSTYAVADT